MNAHLTREQLQALAVNSADMLASFATKEAPERKRGPWSKGDEGRKRRMDRRAAIRAKSFWLNS